MRLINLNDSNFNFINYETKLVEKYFNRDKKTLIQYYKVTKYPCPFNAKGCKRTIKKGMFISVPIDENTIALSWSSCNPKDKFRKYFGWMEAYKKIESEVDIPPMKDRKIEKCYKKFIN